jgi:hypothetical protein
MTLLFPRLKIKLIGHHFDTTEVIKAESEAALNTLTEHDFQDAFKKMAEALGTVHMCKRGLLQERWWPVGLKLVFWPDGSTSTGNNGCEWLQAGRQAERRTYMTSSKAGFSILQVLSNDGTLHGLMTQ